MPKALPLDDEFRADHYLARADSRGECLCIGTGHYYPTWHSEGRKTERLSQLICRVYRGKRPHKHSVVMHSCDNKACIKPEHLSWGTQAQNLKDALAKGRMKPPPKNDMAKMVREGTVPTRLRPHDVITIRKRLFANEPQASIAKDYGVRFQQISKIKLGQRWAHVK